MRFRITLLSILILAATTVAQTNISGTITSDSTLAIGGSPYTITGNLTINNGVTLTVDPNVVVKINSGPRVYVYGSLVATSATFTSSAATPAKGDWGNIQVGNYSKRGSAVFKQCQILYGGAFDATSIYVYNGTVTLNQTDVANSKNDGVTIRYDYNDTLHVTNGSSIYNCDRYGISSSGGSIYIENSTISNCSSVGLLVNSSSSVGLKNATIQTCDWPIRYDGSASVVFKQSNNFTGNTHDGILMQSNGYDSMVWDTVAVPYVLRSDFTINNNKTLTIAPTNVVKSMGGHLYVNGNINAVGTASDSIYFTSYKNDNLMGDTNGDGSTSSPNSKDWFGIHFRDQSNDFTNNLKYCKISFAGRGNVGAVVTDNASPTIENCSIANSYYGAMFIGLSNPTFSNNVIGSSEMVPVALSFEANPTFTDNAFSSSDNEYDAIGILGGTLRGDATLSIRNFTGIVNVTYLLLGTVTVPSGMTLTIDDGIVIKSYDYYHRLIIQGKLDASASESEPIVFTSVKDDGYGNPFDTNKDGTVSVPGIGNWGGIAFENGSDPTSVLNNCIIQFATLPYYGYSINGVRLAPSALTLINSSPTISNCTFKDVNYGIQAFASSNPTISNCKFQNSTYTPILMSVSADPTFSGNTFTNAGLTALGITYEHLPLSGTIKRRDVAGFDNITYVLMGDLFINSGVNVTVDPTVVIKMWQGSGIYVEGGFKADGGAVGEEIVFTSIKDDNYGNPGDTNGDGNASSPKYNDWETINYKETSDDAFSLLNRVIIVFGGAGSNGGVTYNDAAAPVSNLTISDSFYGIKCAGSSTPNISSTAIQNCHSDPIAMSLKSDPTFSDITFTANGSSGIKILEGTLSSDATLAQRSIAGFANIAYIIDQLTISSNAVLTINPGVVLKFYTWYNGIEVNGGLIAEGTSSEKIVFTSIKDDSNGGDTNNDGNTSVPNKGDWRGIWYKSSTLDTVNSLKYSDIRYGGSSGWIYYYEAGAIRIYSANLKMDECTIEQSPSSGIGIYGSASPVISNCAINNISFTPVTLSMFSTPIFTNNVAQNIGLMAIGVKPENYSIDATIPIRDFSGFTNITYYLYGTSTVNSGTKITIPSGLVFKGGSIDVKGALTINGTDTDPVIFTHVNDDAYGNPMDTNDDGSASFPSVNGSRIKFYDVSDDANSTLNNAIFRFSNVAIILDQASPTLTNLTFNKDNWGLYLQGVSNPILLTSVFDDLKYAPFRTSLVSYPASVGGNVITGSTYKAIGVLEESLVQDVVLPKRNFAGIINIPYVFGNYTVASNAILTINPGVILKFFPGRKLTVRKGLQAIGNFGADNTIVFTDIRDDFYGGDTNSDSTDTTPWNSSVGWEGISFEEESLDPLCVIDYAVVQYAGHYYWGNHGAIVTNNSSPTISNSTFKHNYSTLVAKGASNPTINYCDIYQNSGLGINNVNKSFVIDAKNNWWGNDSGPTHSGNPGGTGAEVTDAVDYNPWLGAGASNPIMGDVSLNGRVQAFDASKVLKHVVNPSGPDALSPLQQSVADVSTTGGISAYDASLILQYSVGLITSFPAEVGSAPVSQLPKVDAKTKQYLALQKVNNVNLSFGGAIVNLGEEFSIPVEISNTNGVTALQIAININTALYSVKDVSLEDNFSDYNINYAFNEDTEKLIIAIAGTKTMELEGDLLTLNLVANDDIRGNVDEEIEIEKFLANEKDLTKNVFSESIDFVGKPTTYGLSQNYPNPFNPSTIISYQIPDDGVNVKLVIYNIKGEVVSTLVNTSQNAGRYKVTWNATNNYGGRVSTGVYIYRITAGHYSATKKLMVLK